ncbi:LLM class flavin-dependent oxidoreductase [Frondihabitans sp. PAMC 28766]|uniref:LLM class flavin-dependent oxidoreductase n=1 Tax=Frondihabitans sp. PAMC 28766 TaxID=1795630 RepID=UPI001950D677
MVAASTLAHATEHIGIICTASTTFDNPYRPARQLATLDHLTRGRIGWNMVTSSEDRASQNFGMDKLPEHDLRHEMANEFTEAAEALWTRERRMPSSPTPRPATTPTTPRCTAPTSRASSTRLAGRSTCRARHSTTRPTARPTGRLRAGTSRPSTPT